jgi:hypothetical protein
VKIYHTNDKNALVAFDALPTPVEGEPRIRVVRVSPKGATSYSLAYAEQYTLFVEAE